MTWLGMWIFLSPALHKVGVGQTRTYLTLDGSHLMNTLRYTTTTPPPSSPGGGQEDRFLPTWSSPQNPERMALTLIGGGGANKCSR